jgi:hypothetical protein
MKVGSAYRRDAVCCKRYNISAKHVSFPAQPMRIFTQRSTSLPLGCLDGMRPYLSPWVRVADERGPPVGVSLILTPNPSSDGRLHAVTIRCQVTRRDSDLPQESAHLLRLMAVLVLGDGNTA